MALWIRNGSGWNTREFIQDDRRLTERGYLPEHELGAECRPRTATETTEVFGLRHSTHENCE